MGCMQSPAAAQQAWSGGRLTASGRQRPNENQRAGAFSAANEHRPLSERLHAWDVCILSCSWGTARLMPNRPCLGTCPPHSAPQASDVCILFLGHRMSTKQSQWQREQVGRGTCGCGCAS